MPGTCMLNKHGDGMKFDQSRVAGEIPGIYLFLLPRFELMAQKWVGGNDCGWFNYAPYRWPRRRVYCCFELYHFYRFHHFGRPC